MFLPEPFPDLLNPEFFFPNAFEELLQLFKA
jgi:hypothetical protein